MSATFEEIINRICKHLPEGYGIDLCMEKDAAYVTLENGKGEYASLPDSADRSIIEQLNDALCIANGWNIE